MQGFQNSKDNPCHKTISPMDRGPSLFIKALNYYLPPQIFRPSYGSTVVSSPAAFVERVSPNYLLRPFRTRNLGEKSLLHYLYVEILKAELNKYYDHKQGKLKRKMGTHRPKEAKESKKN